MAKSFNLQTNMQMVYHGKELQGAFIPAEHIRDLTGLIVEYERLREEKDAFMGVLERHPDAAALKESVEAAFKELDYE